MTKPTTERCGAAMRGIYGAETLCVRPQGHGTTGGWGDHPEGHHPIHRTAEWTLPTYFSLYCEVDECHNPHTSDYYTTGSGNGDYIHPVGGGSVPSIRQKYGQRLCKSHALILLGRCYG